MAVAVVQIRQVRMIVSLRDMTMSMPVPCRGRQVGMVMIVMTVIVRVLVLVLDRLVHVNVRMAVHRQERYTRREEQPRCQVDDGERFSQEQGGEDDAEERRGRECDLRAS